MYRFYASKKITKYLKNSENIFICLCYFCVWIKFLTLLKCRNLNTMDQCQICQHNWNIFPYTVLKDWYIFGKTVLIFYDESTILLWHKHEKRFSFYKIEENMTHWRSIWKTWYVTRILMIFNIIFLFIFWRARF